MLGIFFLPSSLRLTWEPCFVFPVAISEQFCPEDCAQVMTTNPKPNKALKVGKKLSGWCWVAGEAVTELCDVHTWLFFFIPRDSYKWVLIQFPTVCRKS